MRLASFITRSGEERIGAAVSVGGEELLVDAPAVWRAEGRDAAPATMLELLELGDDGLAMMRAAIERVAADGDVERPGAAGLAHRSGDVSFLPPVPRPGKVISVGLNYHSHVAEIGIELEKGEAQPAFAKFPSTLVGHEAEIVCSPHSATLDYEVELCLVVGRRCRDVDADAYLDPIVGFTIFNDISARDIQRRERAFGLLCLGKNLDTFGPLGPYIVTKDEVGDPGDIGLELRVNGEVRQHGRTSDMIWSLPEIVSYWSRMTLEPGDVITTGTPSGVASAAPDPKPFLRAGDVVEAEIDGLGVLRNHLVDT